MSDENMNVQSGQTGDLGGNAVQQNTNGFPQAGASIQSTDEQWAQRERDLLAKAYQQAQSLVDKSANRQNSQFQSMIDKFKADFGVTLTPEQAQEMALNQAAKSQPNAQGVAQRPVQNANASDPSFQGFMYYHGMNGNNSELAPLYRQMYELQNTLGVQLEKTDEEYQKFIHPEKKYNKAEFVNAWKQACIDKILRLQAAQKETTETPQQNTNLGQMPLVGSRGKKSNDYDPKRSTKSYVEEYMRNRKE